MNRNFLRDAGKTALEGKDLLPTVIETFGGASKAEKIRRAYALAETAASVYTFAKDLKFSWTFRRTKTVYIKSDDHIYETFTKVIRDRRIEERNLTGGATSVHIKSDYQWDPNAEREVGILRETEGSVGIEGPFEIDGHDYYVRDIDDYGVHHQLLSKGLEPSLVNKIPRQTSRIAITCYSQDGYDTLIKYLTRMSQDYWGSEEPAKYMNFHIFSGYGWNRSRVPSRTLDSVFLRDGQAEAIIEDLKTFFTYEERYDLLGLPWHRGYLFHGPPGTGKTSLSKAIACYFNMNLYYLSLADVEKDSKLIDVISNIPPKSVLILEDVDVMSAATSREQEGGRATLSSLLNSLDGVATPQGLVMIMTTNDINRIDPALIRPGRVDRIEYIGHIESSQFARLMGLHVGHEVEEIEIIPGVTPADVCEVLKRHIDDPEKGVEEAQETFRVGGRGFTPGEYRKRPLVVSSGSDEGLDF